MAKLYMIMHASLRIDAIKVGPWMIFAWTGLGLDHERHHAWKWDGGNSPTTAASSLLGIELTATYLPDSKDQETTKC